MTDHEFDGLRVADKMVYSHGMSSAALVADVLYGTADWGDSNPDPDLVDDVIATISPTDDKNGYLIGLVDRSSNTRLVMLIDVTNPGGPAEVERFTARLHALLHMTVREFMVTAQEKQQHSHPEGEA